MSTPGDKLEQIPLLPGKIKSNSILQINILKKKKKKKEKRMTHFNNACATSSSSRTVTQSSSLKIQNTLTQQLNRTNRLTHLN